MIQDRLCPFRAAILLHQVEASERDVELCAFGILEQHELSVAFALVNFLEPLILANAVLDVDDVISDLKIAEIREESGSLGFLTLRSGDHRIGFIEKIACAENGQRGLRQNHAVGNVGLDDGRGQNITREVGSFISITFAAPGPATEAEGYA